MKKLASQHAPGAFGSVTKILGRASANHSNLTSEQRRLILISGLAGCGLPAIDAWTKPVIRSIILPAHAIVTPIDDDSGGGSGDGGGGNDNDNNPDNNNDNRDSGGNAAPTNPFEVRAGEQPASLAILLDNAGGTEFVYGNSRNKQLVDGLQDVPEDDRIIRLIVQNNNGTAEYQVDELGGPNWEVSGPSEGSTYTETDSYALSASPSTVGDKDKQYDVTLEITELDMLPDTGGNPTTTAAPGAQSVRLNGQVRVQESAVAPQIDAPDFSDGTDEMGGQSASATLTFNNTTSGTTIDYQITVDEVTIAAATLSASGVIFGDAIAELVTSNINAATSTPNYTASVNDTTVTITADTRGAGINTTVPVLVNNPGASTDLVTSEITAFSGGTDPDISATAASSIFTIADGYAASGGDGTVIIDAVTVDLGANDLDVIDVASKIVTALNTATPPKTYTAAAFGTTVVLTQNTAGAAGNVPMVVLDGSYSTA